MVSYEQSGYHWTKTDDVYRVEVYCDIYLWWNYKRLADDSYHSLVKETTLPVDGIKSYSQSHYV